VRRRKAAAWGRAKWQSERHLVSVGCGQGSNSHHPLQLCWHPSLLPQLPRPPPPLPPPPSPLFPPMPTRALLLAAPLPQGPPGYDTFLTEPGSAAGHTRPHPMRLRKQKAPPPRQQTEFCFRPPPLPPPR
jgi:hypothetical protein